MTKTTKLTREVLARLRKDIDAAVAGVGKEYGLKIQTAACRFTAENAHYRLEVETVGANGIANDAERKTFLEYATMFAMSPAWIDKVFTYGGDDFRVAGLNLRKQKRQVLCERCDGSGRKYFFATEMVKTVMGARYPELKPVDLVGDMMASMLGGKAGVK